MIEELTKLAHEQDARGIKTKLREITPDYQPYDMNYSTPNGENR